MQLKQKVIAVIAMVAVVCIYGFAEKTASVSPKLGAQPGNTKRDIRKASAVTKRSSFGNKDQAIVAMQKECQDMDAKIDKLADRSANYTGQAKSKADEVLAKLRTQRSIYADKLNDLTNASKANW